ncbi:hypothetical protein VTO42DRAFT_8471 [Malbranchea cinnamomea]
MMSFTRAAFDNPQVDAAVNPSAAGYRHVLSQILIRIPNPNWRPERQQQALDNGLRSPPVTAAENAIKYYFHIDMTSIC